MKNSQEFVPEQFTIEGLLAVYCKNLKKAHFLNLAEELLKYAHI